MVDGVTGERRSGGNRRGHRASFGSIRQRGPGRFQARYTGPDGSQHTAYTPGGSASFASKTEARLALARVRVDIDAGTWLSPIQQAALEAEAAAAELPLLFGDYAETWLAQRPLATRTRDLYRSLLDKHLLPTWRDVELAGIASPAVREWYGGLDKTKPRAVANAYSLLKTILETAVADELLLANPCRVRGGSQYRRAKEPSMASLGEVAALRAAMPEQYRCAVDLGLWGSLRIGEVIGLQRADVSLSPSGVEEQTGVVHVRRSVGRTRSGREEKLPKSASGTRDVVLPPHIVPALREHLENVTGAGREDWVFPSACDATRNVSADVLREIFEAARHKIGRDDLVFHHLRGIGATLAAHAGATVRELQDRLGHTTPNMALAYQRVAQDRPRQLAEALSRMASGQA
ncbi:MAG: tyrosine-type recombinase/integrase [Mycobacteriales bacterium]